MSPTKPPRGGTGSSCQAGVPPSSTAPSRMRVPCQCVVTRPGVVVAGACEPVVGGPVALEAVLVVVGPGPGGTVPDDNPSSNATAPIKATAARALPDLIAGIS